MRLASTSPPGPALSTHPKLEEDRSAPVLACCKPHPGRFRSLQLPFATSPWRKLCKLSISTSCHVNNTFQTVFSAISRSSFSNFAFSDLVEPTMAGLSKHLVGDSEDFWSCSSTRFDSSIVCEKTKGGKMDEFSKARMPHKFYNSNFPFIGEKL